MSEYALLASNTITLRQFDYFVSTVRLGSMSAAARKFGVTPSAMSQQIGALEGALGRKLFDPRSRRSKLTDFGQEFFTKASDVIDSAYQALSIGRGFGDSAITVGTTSTIATKLIPPLIAAMRLQWNIETIAIRSFTNMRELAAALDHGAIDVALGPLGATAPHLVAGFGMEEFVVACHRDLESRLDGSWPSLAKVAWIRYGPSADITDILARESSKAGVELRYVAAASDIASGLSMVEHGIGIAMVPKMALHRSSRLLSCIRLSAPIRIRLTAHAAQLSPDIEKLLNTITNPELLRKFNAAGLLAVS